MTASPHKYPKVSIIVPNYNYARYLDGRIQSILKQTYQDFEIIILDDRSTDNSREIIEKYRNHPKVTNVDINSDNSGSPFMQWKKGIEMARGEYIWIAEADDMALPVFLEKTVAALDASPNAVLAFSGSEIIDQNGSSTGADWDKWRKYPDKSKGGWTLFDGKEYIVHNLYWKCYVYNASMALFRRSAYSPDTIEESIAMRNAGDWMFWTKLTAKGDIIEIYEKLNLFRRHSDSATVTGDRSGNIRKEEIRVLKYIEDHFDIGSYRRTLRLGRLIKTIRRLYRGATRKELLAEVESVFKIKLLTYHIERANKTFASIFPFLLTPNRDRI